MSAQNAPRQDSPASETRKARKDGPSWKADARIRTADPFITSEVLYQLSYVGRVRHSSGPG